MYQKNKKALDGTIEKHHAPKIHKGEYMIRMVKDLKVVPGKGKGEGSKKMKKTGKNAEKNVKNNSNETSGLLKRSIFWNLPYWKDLMVHHTIDIVNVEKNVCEALIGTLLDIPSKIKDTLKARMDLEEMKLRKNLQHKNLENG
jgi:hypothetical protein